MKDRDTAIALVGKTAELRFRPVIADVPSDAAQTKAATTTTTTAAGATTTTTTPPLDRRRGEGGDRVV